MRSCQHPQGCRIVSSTKISACPNYFCGTLKTLTDMTVPWIWCIRDIKSRPSTKNANIRFQRLGDSACNDFVGGLIRHGDCACVHVRLTRPARMRVIRKGDFLTPDSLNNGLQ